MHSASVTGLHSSSVAHVLLCVPCSHMGLPCFLGRSAPPLPPPPCSPHGSGTCSVTFVGCPGQAPEVSTGVESCALDPAGNLSVALSSLSTRQPSLYTGLCVSRICELRLDRDVIIFAQVIPVHISCTFLAPQPCLTLILAVTILWHLRASLYCIFSTPSKLPTKHLMTSAVGCGHFVLTAFAHLIFFV